MSDDMDEQIRSLAHTLGVDYFGVADLSSAHDFILAQGGGRVAKYPRAPNLWAGDRGRLVRKTIETCAPADFLLGDSSLRPSGWPEPTELRFGRTRGFRVVRGTDALPLPGELRRIGACATLVHGPWNPAQPVTSLRHLLTTANYPLTPAGRRLSLPGSAIRWARQKFSKDSRT